MDENEAFNSSHEQMLLQIQFQLSDCCCEQRIVSFFFRNLLFLFTVILSAYVGILFDVFFTQLLSYSTSSYYIRIRDSSHVGVKW